MDTIQKLDNIGRSDRQQSSDTIFQKGGHVAHVHVSTGSGVSCGGDEQCSSSTSGIYSVEGSEGSNSPEYNSWRQSRTQPASTQRWSVQGELTDTCLESVF